MYLFYLAYDYNEQAIPDHPCLALCRGCLSNKELKHLAKYKHPKTAVQQTLSYGLRRLVLATLIGTSYRNRHSEINDIGRYGIRIDESTLALAKSLTLDFSPYGKPYLKSFSNAVDSFNPINFSVSHCDGFICILLVKSQDKLGVDVERIKRFDYHPLLNCMHPCEQKKIHTERDFLFFWTRKEAYLKALGSGLVDELSKINTSEQLIIDERSQSEKNSIAGNEPMYCHCVDIDPTYIIHACHRHTNPTFCLVNLRQLLLNG